VFTPNEYELIDFGQGRKLERFGAHLIDRPSPAAQSHSMHRPDDWPLASARYDRRNEREGVWQPADQLPQQWTIRHGPICFELRPTPFGHLGVFPEQAANWDWLTRQLSTLPRPCKVLNLFAYTGGSTLAAAAAGASVVHVDSAKNVVSWARRNAELSNLTQASVRWICEDAQAFVQREVRRGNRYDAVILDPPSYGHGPKGQVWKVERHLESLLTACGTLLDDRAQLVLLTCHSLGFSQWDLQQLLARTSVPASPKRIEAGTLTLECVEGRQLSSGLVARWSANQT
jgi:23S rRNA (cytosine1962-C5)-methyltransferase